MIEETARYARAVVRNASTLEFSIGLGVLAIGAAWLGGRQARVDRLPDTGPSTSGRGMTRHLSDAFLRSVDAFAGELRARGARLTAEDILAAFLSESGIRSTSKNALGFGGLNGMGESARRALGAPVDLGAWTSLTPDEQFPFVRRFVLSNLASFAGGDASVLFGPGRFYLLNFTPAHIRRPDSFVIFRRGSNEYAANAGVDVDQDGAIDVADVRNFLFRSVTRNRAYWNEVRGRLASALGRSSGPIVAGVAPFQASPWSSGA